MPFTVVFVTVVYVLRVVEDGVEVTLQTDELHFLDTAAALFQMVAPGNREFNGVQPNDEQLHDEDTEGDAARQ